MRPPQRGYGGRRGSGGRGDGRGRGRRPWGSRGDGGDSGGRRFDGPRRAGGNGGRSRPPTRGRTPGRGGGGGMRGGSKVVVNPHKHKGVFVAKANEDALCTRNMCPGESVYGEKRISVQIHIYVGNDGKLNENAMQDYAERLKKVVPHDLLKQLIGLKGRAFWDMVAEVSMSVP